MKFYRAIFPYGGAFADDAVVSVPTGAYDLMNVHFLVDEWPPQMFETAGVYAASAFICGLLKGIDATGVAFGPCRVSKSSQFLELYPDLQQSFPDYFHLQIHGVPRVDDFGIEGANQLFISERVASTLKRLEIDDLSIYPAE